VTPTEFETLAGDMWDRIPDPLKEGVEALSVESRAVEHDALEGVFTLGECITESYPGEYGGPGDTRSQVVLYHGSFAALARREPGFDWQEELWETLLHELLHHREVAAGGSGLDDFDWAVEQNQRRHAGETFDPGFYKAVPPADDGTVRLDSEIFLEVRVPVVASEAVFRWRGGAYSVRMPETARAFIEVVNLAGGRLWLVVERRRRWWQRLLGPGNGNGAASLAQVTRHALPRPVS
jgi:hypothetical protein